MAKATQRQLKCIWAYCVQCGNKNTDWFRLGKDGKIDKLGASKVINKINTHRKYPTSPSKAEAAGFGISSYLPGFFVIREPAERPPPPDVSHIDISETNVQPASVDKLTPIQPTDALEEFMTDLDEVEEVILNLGMDDAPACVEEPEERIEITVHAPNSGYIKHQDFDKVAALAEAGINVLLSGPAGCGKTRMTKEIATVRSWWYVNRPFAGGQRFSQLFGTTKMSDGNTQFVNGELLQACQRTGDGIINLDEPFAAEPDILLGLNSILEQDTRSFLTPIGEVKVEPGVRFIASANTVGRQVSRQYTGAQRADDSLLDRFVTVPMDYDPKVEAALLASSNLNAQSVQYFTTRLKELRESVRVSRIDFDPSTRRMTSCIKAYKAGLSRETAFEVSFLNSLSVMEREKVRGV